jgi:hypothetical protein
VILIGFLLVAVALVWGARTIAREIAAARGVAGSGRALELLAVFAPALAAVDQDPRVLLVWAPLARAARQLFAEDFAALDRAFGGPFPFGRDRIESAHAKWTADWLAWERSHDSEYKSKTAAAAAELSHGGDDSPARARLNSIEQEKLERYQRRYEEYIRVAKALQALAHS